MAIVVTVEDLSLPARESVSLCSYASPHRKLVHAKNTVAVLGIEPLEREQWACITPLGQDKKAGARLFLLLTRHAKTFVGPFGLPIGMYLYDAERAGYSFGSSQAGVSKVQCPS